MSAAHFISAKTPNLRYNKLGP